MKNESALLAQGYSFCRQRNMPSNWGHIVNFTKDGSFPEFWLWPNGLRKLESCLSSSASKTIISAEDFFFLNPQAIADLSDTLQRHFSKITIVIYLRRQDKLALSHKAQSGRTPQSAVVFGTELRPLPTITPEVRHYLDFHQRIMDWQIIFTGADFIIRDYDATVSKRGDIAKDIYEAIGVDDRNFLEVGRVNESIQRNAVYLSLLLRQSGVSQADIKKLWKNGFISNTGGKLKASRSESTAFLRAFDEENERLAMLPGGVTFSDDVVEDVDSEEQAESFEEYFLKASPALLGSFINQASVANGMALADAAEIVIKKHPFAASKILKVARQLNPGGTRISRLMDQLGSSDSA
ncbi:hypothetical protein [Ponticoccus sp. (in: a-proteobacteria)]|uniref:hypothetical protein n=1 Tax=Ponticoccus sp. (in: a-proteobacteria) TaxID=1925025 RepID=UPI003AB8B9C2